MTTIDMTLFAIDPTDHAVLRAAKLGSAAGIAHAEQAHAAGDTTIDLAAAAEHQAPADLPDPPPEVSAAGVPRRAPPRWGEPPDPRGAGRRRRDPRRGPGAGGFAARKGSERPCGGRTPCMARCARAPPTPSKGATRRPLGAPGEWSPTVVSLCKATHLCLRATLLSLPTGIKARCALRP